MCCLFLNHQSPKLTHLKNLFFLFALITSTTLTAQERTPLKGKIKSDAEDLEGVYVINKTADASVTTTRGGYFTINAKVNDTIIFSAVNIIAKNITIEEEDMKQELFIVPVDKYVHKLDELVIIDYSNRINAETLGLVPRGQKQLTMSEKRVFTSRDGVDGVINLFSGRTKMLEKADETAKKISVMDKIDYIYTEEDLVTKFHIPKEYVKGFVFFLAEDANFARALKDKNETMAKFLMSGLSGKFLELIKDEK